MVEPITMAILAGGSIGAKAIGGILAAKAARERAEFFMTAYEEQEKLNNIVYAQSIREDLGAEVANIGSRGVAGANVKAAAFDSVFGKQLQRVQSNQQIQFQRFQQMISGNVGSQNALLDGLKSILGTANTTAGAINDYNAAASAAADTAATTTAATAAVPVG